MKQLHTIMGKRGVRMSQSVIPQSGPRNGPLPNG